MPGFMTVFTGLPDDRFIHSGSFSHEDANDFAEYVQKCKDEGVALIAWDSRIANTGDKYFYTIVMTREHNNRIMVTD